MSLNFDAVDDMVESASNPAIGNVLSGCAWFWAPDRGENNQGTILSTGVFGNERARLRWYSTLANALHFISCRATTVGNWAMTAGALPYSAWLWAGFTHDANATGNDPTLYTLVGSTFSKLTVGSGLSQVSAPSGTLPSDGQAFRVGNSSGAAHTFSGLIGEAALWKRMLSEQDMRAIALLGVNTCPDHFYYVPMDRGRNQNLGSSGIAMTVTGALWGQDPPTQPAGRCG